jgi:peptide/nickel transport system substrate-binding protein
MKRKLNGREFNRLAIGLFLALTVIVAGCAPAAPAATSAPATSAATEAPVPAGPKILKIRLYGDIQNMDPAMYISANDLAVGTNVFSGLVTYAPNSYDVVNDLAESISTSEDGLQVTFKLKEGVMWQKGYGEVTTEDVKFSYERFLDPELASGYAGDWEQLDRVEIVDKYNGILVFKKPFAPLMTSTMPVSSGWVIPKKYGTVTLS